MAVRPTMSDLIAFVRELIFDPSDGDTKFTDQYIQDQLDLNRLDLYTEWLKSADTLTTEGTIEWHDFFAPVPHWETDYVIQQLDGDVVTPDNAYPMIGKFNFTAHQTEPLAITGKAYNVYRVAGNLMTTWIAEQRSDILSWTADGTTIRKANAISHMSGLARQYLAMAWGFGGSSQIKLVRKDIRN